MTKLRYALALGLMLTTPVGVTTFPANAAVITNRAVGIPLQEAMQLANGEDWEAAIAKATEARNAAGITQAEIDLIDRLIAGWRRRLGALP